MIAKKVGGDIEGFQEKRGRNSSASSGEREEEQITITYIPYLERIKRGIRVSDQAGSLDLLLLLLLRETVRERVEKQKNKQEVSESSLKYATWEGSFVTSESARVWLRMCRTTWSIL